MASELPQCSTLHVDKSEQLKVRLHDVKGIFSTTLLHLLLLISDAVSLSDIPVSSCYASSYLANSLRRTVDVAGRQRLRSSDVTTLVVPSTRRSTFSDHAFPIAAPRTWNRLPASVRAATSLSTFRQELKTFLFRSSYNGHYH